MTLLYNHFSSLPRIPPKLVPPAPPDRTQIPASSLAQPPISQARIDPITPSAAAAAALLTRRELPLIPLRVHELHQVQALLQGMKGIRPALPTGELVNILLPKPTEPTPI